MRPALCFASLAGRFVLDILRTVLQTAIAARVPLQEYLLDLFQTAPEDIAAAPENYTPHAWAQRNLPQEPPAVPASEDSAAPSVS